MSTAARDALLALYQQVDERTQATAAGHSWWPCKRGCSRCCRELGAQPVFNRTEWEYLWEGFEQLEPEVQAAIRSRVEQLRATPAPGPYTCPFLEPTEGACLVYAHRPTVCRSYGYYTEGVIGSWCVDMEALQQQNNGHLVTWGHQGALDAQLHRVDPSEISLLDWMDAHPATR